MGAEQNKIQDHAFKRKEITHDVCMSGMQCLPEQHIALAQGPVLICCFCASFMPVAGGHVLDFPICRELEPLLKG